MDISNLIEAIGNNKKAAAECYKAYKDIIAIEDGLKTELMALMESTGLKSAKGQNFLASISSRSDIIVIDEQAVVDWLKHDPNVEEDQYIGLKLTNFKPLANEVLKQTGEIIPGTDRVIKESLSIKENK